MATANQEKTYNEFIKFYDLADKLIVKAQNCHEEYAVEQFDEIEKMVYFIEDAADKLTSDYIEIVKNSNDQGKVEEIEKILSDIKTKTHHCKTTLKNIYESNS